MQEGGAALYVRAQHCRGRGLTDLSCLCRRVLPTSPDGGMIEFVESVPLARVLAEHRTILAFLHQGIPDGPGALPAPQPHHPSGVKAGNWAELIWR